MGYNVIKIPEKKLPYNYYKTIVAQNEVSNFIYYTPSLILKIDDKQQKGFHPARLIALMLQWLSVNDFESIEKYKKILFENSIVNENEILFLYKFYNPLHQNIKEMMKPDWVSGFAQGLGLLFFSRYYKNTDNEILEKIRNGLLSERIIDYLDNGECVLFHEYERKCDALNGHIYAIYGLYEHWYWTNSELSLELIKKGIEYIVRNFNKYRNEGNASYYCSMHKMLCDKVGGKYHAVHISQLLYLYQFTGCEKLRELANILYSDFKPERKIDLKTLFK